MNSGEEVYDEMDFQDADQIEQELDLQHQFSGNSNNYLAPLQQKSLENENEILKTQLEIKDQ